MPLFYISLSSGFGWIESSDKNHIQALLIGRQKTVRCVEPVNTISLADQASQILIGLENLPP